MSGSPDTQPEAAADKPERGFTGVVYFHGMGRQRHYEEMCRLVEGLDRWVYRAHESDASRYPAHHLEDLRGRDEELKEGGNTRLVSYMRAQYQLPSGERQTIFDAAMQYQAEGVPLIVIAGKEYGSGSSRDWAAKGTFMLGVRAVIAESFERIHRSNLIGMGVLPLQFLPGQTAKSLDLCGEESFAIRGISDGLKPGGKLGAVATPESGPSRSFEVVARIDTTVELDYYRHGGILQYVLRQLLKN